MFVSFQACRARGALSGLVGLSLLLAGCGGGGGGGGTPAATGGATTPAAVDQSAINAQLAKESDAVRLAQQGSFGPTKALVDHILSIGTTAWIDEQLAATGSSYADIAANPPLIGSCGTDNQCYRNKFSREPVAMRFYADAMGQPDQLRQRVAFAFSQLMVTSALQGDTAAGLASFNQILLDNAFGSFRALLMAVTMNGYMGDYLDMANSAKAAPSENYAREMLQLFSMGPDQLAMDGTAVKDSTGATVANYGPDDIKGIARALTGWTYAHINGGTDSASNDYSQPMVPAASSRYDSGAKSFLGVTVPSGAAAADSVAAVVDAAVNNASTPPHVAHFLIQHLVTANPSPAYVARVAAVFVNNGANVRGDLKAVVRAILTDGEARGAGNTGDTSGKVKEPILLMTAIARLAGTTTDGYVFTQRDNGLSQPVFQAPSVFSFYPPDYPLPQSSTLVSPASKLMSTGSVISRHNLVWDWTMGAATDRSDFKAATTVTGATGSTDDWSTWEALGTDTATMIDRIDLLMAAHTLTAAQKAALKTAAEAITDPTPSLQARKRAQVMLYVVGTSPLFQVDR